MNWLWALLSVLLIIIEEIRPEANRFSWFRKWLISLYSNDLRELLDGGCGFLLSRGLLSNDWRPVEPPVYGLQKCLHLFLSLAVLTGEMRHWNPAVELKGEINFRGRTGHLLLSYRSRWSFSFSWCWYVSDWFLTCLLMLLKFRCLCEPLQECESNQTAPRLSGTKAVTKRRSVTLSLHYWAALGKQRPAMQSSARHVMRAAESTRLC